MSFGVHNVCFDPVWVWVFQETGYCSAFCLVWYTRLSLVLSRFLGCYSVVDNSLTRDDRHPLLFFWGFYKSHSRDDRGSLLFFFCGFMCSLPQAVRVTRATAIFSRQRLRQCRRLMMWPHRKSAVSCMVDTYVPRHKECRIGGFAIRAIGHHCIKSGGRFQCPLVYSNSKLCYSL